MRDRNRADGDAVLIPMIRRFGYYATQGFYFGIFVSFFGIFPFLARGEFSWEVFHKLALTVLGVCALLAVLYRATIREALWTFVFLLVGYGIGITWWWLSTFADSDNGKLWFGYVAVFAMFFCPMFSMGRALELDSRIREGRLTI